MIDNYAYLRMNRVAKYHGAVGRFYINDERGSTVMVLQPNGLYTDRIDYDPFGSVWLSSGSERYKYTGPDSSGTAGTE